MPAAVSAGLPPSLRDVCPDSVCLGNLCPDSVCLGSASNSTGRRG